MILVSHFLGEILALSDTVTILRDGRVVRTAAAADETEASLISGMLGRTLGRTFPPKAPPPADAPATLVVENLTAPGVSGVSLAVRAGEIVALAGLIGAGRSELARAIFGAAPATAARLTLGDAPIGASPEASMPVMDFGYFHHPVHQGVYRLRELMGACVHHGPSIARGFEAGTNPCRPEQ